jgi:hypothetical protein
MNKNKRSIADIIALDEYDKDDDVKRLKTSSISLCFGKRYDLVLVDSTEFKFLDVLLRSENVKSCGNKMVCCHDDDDNCFVKKPISHIYCEFSKKHRDVSFFIDMLNDVEIVDAADEEDVDFYNIFLFLDFLACKTTKFQDRLIESKQFKKIL